MLDAVMHQQKLLAENIASINNKQGTSSYLSFDKVMDELAGAKGSSAALQDISDRIKVREFDHISNQSATASLDKEIAMMSSNIVQYKALLSAMSKHSSIMKSVIDLPK